MYIALSYVIHFGISLVSQHRSIGLVVVLAKWSQAVTLNQHVIASNLRRAALARAEPGVAACTLTCGSAGQHSRSGQIRSGQVA